MKQGKTVVGYSTGMYPPPASFGNFLYSNIILFGQAKQLSAVSIILELHSEFFPDFPG